MNLFDIDQTEKSTQVKCPYCKAINILIKHRNCSEENSEILLEYSNENNINNFSIHHLLFTCGHCNKTAFWVSLSEIPTGNPMGIGVEMSHEVGFWRLLPSFICNYYDENIVPSVIFEDYQEACSIISLSPKASATLFRRCLQWMIRDFWGISKNRLIDEITDLKDKVSIDVWEAIDTLRNVGNIGAHMGKDINYIIDIDEWEVEQLKWLIEFLLEEWYVNRYNRQQRLEWIKQLWIDKQEIKQSFK